MKRKGDKKNYKKKE